ncbi:hypothetical protein N9W89_07965 [Hellea sp.]|nr:hypothetical protein [Hellea sp.]
MNSHIIIGMVAISVGVLHLVALHKEWGWYMNNWQSRSIREQWGEGSFVAVTYFACTACIVIGFMSILGLSWPIGQA